MSFPHPDEDERDQLEAKCNECGSQPGAWCLDEEGKTRAVLHRARQPVKAAPPPPPQPPAVLGAACKDCGLEAFYEVRTPDHMACSCPLHLFSTMAYMLLGSNVVEVKVINQRARNSDRREAIEIAMAPA